jgi:hypothetical protein
VGPVEVLRFHSVEVAAAKVIPAEISSTVNQKKRFTIFSDGS